MNDVGAGWLMTSLTTSPLLVALIQAATTLPMALLALPGGALADIFDKRKLLLVAQIWSLACALMLFAITISGRVDAYWLLGLVFLTACASAISAPTYQSIIGEIVPRESLPQAVAMGGLGVNIARAIGPAIGGVLVADAGPAWVFLLNGLTYLGTIGVILRWKREASSEQRPREKFGHAIKAGLRFVSGSPELKTVVVRAVTLFLFASATWSLLPIFARLTLRLDAAEYGVLLGCIGAGAIVGAFLLPRLKGLLNANRLSVVSALGLAIAMASLASAQSMPLAAAACLLLGVAWIMIMATIQSAAQLNAPSWVKARALGIFLLAFQGSMAIGAILWGTIAGEIGVRSTLLVAAAALASFQLLAIFFRLKVDATRDLEPSYHWPMPTLVRAIDDDRGPVLVTLEYRVPELELDRFLIALKRLRAIRLRDGAYRWGYWQATDDPERIMEFFEVDSWLEHLRQHDRVTNEDRQIQDEVNQFSIGGKPIVRHWLNR